MKKIYLITILIYLITETFGQNTLIWSRDFEAQVHNHYTEHPEIRVKNDTINVIGRKQVLNEQVLVRVVYDLNGDTLFTTTYGNDSISNNTIVDYEIDEDNSIYLLHKESLGFYKSKIIIQKYIADGTLVWLEQIYDIADTSWAPSGLKIFNDTSILVTAYKEYDYPEPGDDVILTQTKSYIFAYNNNGTQIWLHAFDPAEVNYFFKKPFIHNSDAYLFVNNNQYVNNMVKINFSFGLVYYNNLALQNGVGNIQLTPDTNFLISSWGRYRITKMSLTGSIIWTELYPTNLPYNVCCDEIRSMIQDNAGNIYITGRHYGTDYGTPNYTNGDILTIKYDSNKNLVWQQRYEYLGNNFEAGNFITLKNGFVYVGGQSQRLGVTTDYDYVVLKIDSASGALAGEYRYNAIQNGNDVISSLHVFDDGKVALTGLSFNSPGHDLTTQLLSDVIISIPETQNLSKVEIYPNPLFNNEKLTIKGEDFGYYFLHNVLGQCSQEGLLNKGGNNMIELKNLPEGMYFLRLMKESKSFTHKIVVK